MIELKPSPDIINEPILRVDRWEYPQRSLMRGVLDYVLPISVGIIALLVFVGTRNIRLGLFLFSLWLLTLLVRPLWNLYKRWHLGRRTLLISTSEPMPGEDVQVVFAQTFRQAAMIEKLTFELVMREEWSGPDPFLGEEIIQTVSQSDRPVQGGQIYKTNITLLIPPDAKPSLQPKAHDAPQISWRIRVTLKCQSMPEIKEYYPLVVVDGDIAL